MPHVTLLYPFRPREEFDEALGLIGGLGVGPLDVTLLRFRHFRYSPRSFTIWLDPEPSEPWLRVQAALQARFPDCDEVASHPGGFVPHLSVGQARGPALAQELQATWRPVRFHLTELALIWRERRRPFQVALTVRLSERREI